MCFLSCGCTVGLAMSSDSVCVDEQPIARPKRPRQRPTIQQGPRKLFVVVACERDGLWRSFAGGGAALPTAWASATAPLVVGVVCAPAFALFGAEPVVGNAGREFMRTGAQRRTRGESVYGFVEYPIEGWARLQTPMALDGPSGAVVVERLADQRIEAWSGGVGCPTVAEAIGTWAGTCVATAGLVRIGRQAAKRMLCGEWNLLHCVAITKRTARKMLLDPRQPSRKVLSAFLANTSPLPQKGAPTVTVATNAAETNKGWRFSRHDPELVLDWLCASAFVRDIRKVGEAADAFAALFGRSAGVSHAKLMGTLRMVHAEVLRRARVRLDCIAMLLYRRFWTTLVAAGDETTINIYLYADASPQWRGLELYASSFDLFDGSRFQHKLFPMVSLDKEFGDAAGKCLALLWQVFLMVGPSYEVLRFFCRRVRSITTDQGVERFLADFPAALPDFFRLVDPKFKAPQEDGDVDFLFPRALAVPGWMHLWDLLIRRGLEMLSFWPQWLQGLKAIVQFLRQSTHTPP